jgi:hypothetical protein
VTSGGSFGASPLQQHLGLGRDARIVSLELFWPASGIRQRFTDVPTNGLLEIREGADQYTAVARKPLPLGRRTAESAAAASRGLVHGG